MINIINQDKECEMCGSPPTSICFKCSMYLCDSCFKVIHNQKKKADHKKEKIDPEVPIDTKCPEHPNNIINLFCVDEKGINIFIYIIF